MDAPADQPSEPSDPSEPPGAPERAEQPERTEPSGVSGPFESSGPSKPFEPSGSSGSSDPSGPSDPATLAAVLADVRCVMFDFDGPLCPLFDGRPATGFAVVFHAVLRQAGLHPSPLAGMTDPYEMFRELPRAFPGRDIDTDAELREVARTFEEYLTLEEFDRVNEAEPTDGALDCIRALHAAGRTLAVTTNNSAGPVQTYLKVQGVDRLFDGRVFGRGWDPRRLKPDPDSVYRALAAVAPLGIPRGRCLLVGDTPADLAAARGAEVEFIGYCRSPDKERRLREAGARYWVRSLHALTAAVARL